MLYLNPIVSTRIMLTLPLSDAAWLLELADALEDAIDEAEEDDVYITKDLAEQISKHLKIIVRDGTTNTPN